MIKNHLWRSEEGRNGEGRKLEEQTLSSTYIQEEMGGGFKAGGGGGQALCQVWRVLRCLVQPLRLSHCVGE